jgi:hypothetical protein
MSCPYHPCPAWKSHDPVSRAGDAHRVAGDLVLP